MAASDCNRAEDDVARPSSDWLMPSAGSSPPHHFFCNTLFPVVPRPAEALAPPHTPAPVFDISSWWPADPLPRSAAAMGTPYRDVKRWATLGWQWGIALVDRWAGSCGCMPGVLFAFRVAVRVPLKKACACRVLCEFTGTALYASSAGQG